MAILVLFSTRLYRAIRVIRAICVKNLSAFSALSARPIYSCHSFPARFHRVIRVQKIRSIRSIRGRFITISKLLQNSPHSSRPTDYPEQRQGQRYTLQNGDADKDASHRDTYPKPLSWHLRPLYLLPQSSWG